ncbi:hypothetical protein ABZP36_011872 [Zizania latifolia]
MGEVAPRRTPETGGVRAGAAALERGRRGRGDSGGGTAGARENGGDRRCWGGRWGLTPPRRTVGNGDVGELRWRRLLSVMCSLLNLRTQQRFVSPRCSRGCRNRRLPIIQQLSCRPADDRPGLLADQASASSSSNTASDRSVALLLDLGLQRRRVVIPL